MLLNHLKITIRGIYRDKAYALINVLGLAVGMASCLLILLFIRDEQGFDRFLDGAQRVYQVNVDGNFGGQEFRTSTSPPPVGRIMASEFPEVEAYTRVFQPYDAVVQRRQQGKALHLFTESNILAVDSNFLAILPYRLVAGNPASCLREPGSLVITETMARKYFGSASPLGQWLHMNDKPLRITGVLADVPTQSTLQFDFLQPIRDYEVVTYFDWSWVWLNVTTFVRLTEPVAASPGRLQALQAKFPAMVRKHAVAAFERIGQPLDKFLQKGGRWNFALQPLTDLHLGSAGIGSSYNNLGDAKQVRTFGIIALFIVVLACINFMNLATARSLKRAREVGVRKVLGSSRATLIRQFLTESMCYSLLGAILGLTLVILLLPAFNQLAGKTFTAEVLTSPEILGLAALLALGVGLLAGSYPALYLTSFQPVKTLKNGLLKSSGAHRLVRNGLVVFQFVVSTALIIGTIVVYAQLRYAQNKDLGLDKENVLLLPNAERLGARQEAFRVEVLRLAEVQNACLTTSVPLKGGFGDFYVPQQTRTDRNVAKDLLMYSFLTDKHLVPTLKIRMLKGRNFSDAFNDSTSVILNEAAARQIGWKDPIGKTLTYPGGNNQQFTVIGVMKNFDMNSVRWPTDPFALFHTSSKTYTVPKSNLLIRVRAGQLPAAVQSVEAMWRKFAPDTPFDYTFLDREYASAYRTEQQTGRVFGIFTGLAIFIACLGLFGLATFTAEQRTKEIGVRKVLGASVASLVVLLSRDFLRLVGLAIVLATPLAGWAMYRWLADFAYKIELQWWMFASAGGLAILIALLTVSFRAMKAALVNPVTSLRAE